MSKSKMEQLWWWRLVSDDEAVREALLELYFQQTDDERSSFQTSHANKSGFSKAHVKLGTHLAKILLSKKNLSALEMKQARELVQHYPRQLSELIPIASKSRTSISVVSAS